MIDDDDLPALDEPRIHFHAALFLVALPIVAVPVTFGLAAYHRWYRPPEPHDRPWIRAIAALAILDALVAIALVSIVSVGLDGLSASATSSPVRRAVIGVRLESSSDPAGARIAEVSPASPAERAGLRAGDVIVALDGGTIDDADALSTAIGGGAPDVERTVAIVRDTERLEIEVTPVAPGSVTSPGLFEPAPGRCVSPTELDLGVGSLSLYAGAVLVGLALLWLAVRRRARAPAFIPAFYAVVVVSLTSPLWVSALCCRWLGGHTAAENLLGLLGQTVVMALLALGLRAWMRRAEALREGVLSPPRIAAPVAYGLGLYYAACLLPRIGIILASVILLTDAGAPPTGGPLSSFVDADLGVTGSVMLFVAAAILGPVAEELLFRGCLLPWLGQFARPWHAILGTALVFGLLHVQHGMLLVGPMTLGVLLGWARIRTAGLGAPIALHVTFNAFATTVILLLP